MNSTELMTFTILGIIYLFFYLLPTMIAYFRKHRRLKKIFLMNFFFGLLCGIGWIVALVWAFDRDVDPS